MCVRKEENMKRIFTPQKLQEVIGYTFRDQELLLMALTHRSYFNEHRGERPRNNERLEFLGDAVLELVSSEFLYHMKPEQPEGQMTRMRASIVCEPTLAFCTKELQLGEYLYLGKGEAATGGRGRDSIVSDAMEALIGAIYLDGGFANAKEFILKFILNDLEHKKLFFDSKTILQEMVQSKENGTVTYELLKEEGPDHDKVFTSRAIAGGLELGRGSGRTKKAAEQHAAYQAIIREKQTGRFLNVSEKN